MKTLLIYFILNSSCHWEFLAIEHVGSEKYCEVLASNVAGIFANKPGNMRIVCADDRGFEL